MPADRFSVPNPKSYKDGNKYHREHGESQRMPRDSGTREPQYKLQQEKYPENYACHTCPGPQQSLVTFREIRLLNRARLEIVPTVTSRGIRRINELAVRAVHLRWIVLGWRNIAITLIEGAGSPRPGR